MTEPENSLIDAWLEGSLNDEQARELDQWLRQDDANMRQFVEANIRDQHLREVVRSLAQAEEVTRQIAPPISSKRMQRVPLAMFALATAATILLAFWFVLPRQPVRVQASVIAMADVQLIGVDGVPAIGKTLSLDSFRLASGSLEVLLPLNVRVEFVAPVEVVFENQNRLRLIEGQMNADVGDGGQGFTVVTSAGEIVDFGTRFGLEVDRDGESRVAVFSGSVEFHPTNATSPQEVITLTEGEALRFSARAGLRRWQQVAVAADKAGLSRIDNHGVVREVRDNLGEGDLRPFYSVIPGGMQPGALAFNDKPNPVWSALPGDKFPAWLEGADLIRTYYNFRYIKNYELTLELNQPADVYVLVATPGEVPNWLKERFEPVGVSIRAGAWHPAIATHPAATMQPDGPYLTFSIWKCEAGPGELKLGAPLEHRVPGVHSLMYGLAVKAKSTL